MKFTFLISLACLAASVLFATSASAFIIAGMGCGNERANITITLNELIPANTTDLKAVMDGKIKDIEQATKEATATYKLQSKNYNISSGNESGYRLSGSIMFWVEPSDKALTVMQALTKKGYVARANINSYNNGNVNCPPAAIAVPQAN